jgi:hypothetical protein
MENKKAKQVGSIVTGSFACIACILFLVFVIQGGFTNKALIAMVASCMCSSLNGIFSAQTING